MVTFSSSLCIRLNNAGKYYDIILAILAKKIIFSDEAYFDLGGYVNKQNCRIWEQFENEQGEAVTLNGNRCILFIKLSTPEDYFNHEFYFSFTVLSTLTIKCILTTFLMRYHWLRHLTFIFQLGLISWMVTLSSCLIWQIISFILPPNEYACVYAWTTLGSGPAIDSQKMPTW